MLNQLSSNWVFTFALASAMALALAWWITAMVERYAYSLGLVSVPNHRSSHSKKTPHGGGVSIVVIGTIAGGMITAQTPKFLWLTVALGAVIAGIGLWDDVKGLSSRLRFAVQAVCVGFTLFALHPLPPVVGVGTLALVCTYALLWFGGIWWINLFNFMDGIDGIAGAQTLTMLLSAAALALALNLPFWHYPILQWMLLLACATLGFLAHNWPPARIFMGDVGSTYIAYMLYCFALLSIQQGWLSYPTWLILGAAFIVDASVTLVRRMALGERWSQAHRSHAYQRLARRWGGHRPVTLGYAALNLFWLAPLAWLAITTPSWAWMIALIAYAPLVALALSIGAGKPDHA